MKHSKEIINLFLKVMHKSKALIATSSLDLRSTEFEEAVVYGIIIYTLLHFVTPYLIYYFEEEKTKVIFFKFSYFYIKRDITKSEIEKSKPNNISINDDSIKWTLAIPVFLCKSLNIKKWGGLINYLWWMFIVIIIIKFFTQALS